MVFGELLNAPAVELDEGRVIPAQRLDGGQFLEAAVVGPEAAGGAEVRQAGLG
ncbi:hypothetical protein D3C78_1799460 [compost metagenome]